MSSQGIKLDYAIMGIAGGRIGGGDGNRKNLTTNRKSPPVSENDISTPS